MITVRIKNYLFKNKINLIKFISFCCITSIFFYIAIPTSVFAMFTSSVSTVGQTITSANYDIEPIFKDNSNNVIDIKNNNGVYILKNGIYYVTLEPKGTASTGYCNIKINENETYTDYFTSQIQKDKKFSFILDINSNTDVKISFNDSWGTYLGKTNLNEGNTIKFGNLKSNLEESIHSSKNEVIDTSNKDIVNTPNEEISQENSTDDIVNPSDKEDLNTPDTELSPDNIGSDEEIIKDTESIIIDSKDDTITDGI